MENGVVHAIYITVVNTVKANSNSWGGVKYKITIRIIIIPIHFFFVKVRSLSIFNKLYQMIRLILFNDEIYNITLECS